MAILNTVRSSPESEPALDYKLYTTPHPIRVSPEGAEEGGAVDPERAQLVFVAANNTNKGIRLKKISLRIPTGELAAQLALSLERAEASITLGWPSKIDGEWVEFETSDPYEEIALGGGFSFTVAGVPVNHEVGAVELDIEENQSTGANGAMTILTGKFPRDFYLDHFAAESYEIDNGGTVVLTWKRSEGVTTKLIHGGNDPEDVTRLERKEIKDVTTTTTFYLIGQVGDVEIMRSVLVTVLNPDLAVNNLTVNGAVKGDLSIEGMLSASEGATIYKDLRVTAGDDEREDRLLWVDKDGADFRGRVRLRSDSAYERSGELEVSGTIAAQGDVTVAAGKKLTVEKIDDHGDGITLEAGLTQTSGGISTGSGGLTANGPLDAHGSVTANEGLKVYKDLRLTKGSDGVDDRMLWADEDTVDIRGRLRLKSSPSRSGSGELEADTSVKVSGAKVICSGNGIRIRNQGANGGSNHLNCTTRDGDDWSDKSYGKAYWRSNSYDSHSDLKIEKL
ncbi:hypothetical protein J0910_17645 [Nocardiopsis sp. CNT-189]|uniref:hypothetical protein n=1 Tax=Nocardiopsis oceanisediminis TaxID=2816862 RepID=UPI003B3240A5